MYLIYIVGHQESTQGIRSSSLWHVLNLVLRIFAPQKSSPVAAEDADGAAAADAAAADAVAAADEAVVDGPSPLRHGRQLRRAAKSKFDPAKLESVAPSFFLFSFRTMLTTEDVLGD